METPKDLQDDDEWERMVQEEHSRVMRKAKHEKIQRERQELIDIGVGALVYCNGLCCAV